MSISLEDIYPFPPASFLHFSTEIEKSKGLPKVPYKKPFLLPSTEIFLEEESFAQVSMCYDAAGFYIAVFIDKPFEDIAFPNVEEGDSVELFFDTRDLKEAGSIHKFCHHFIFLPKEIGGMVACEMSKFRAEDAHPLCDQKLLEVETTFGKKSYEMRIFIDREALHGFDEVNFHKVGFTYRINRKGGASQHFNSSSKEYSIEKYPSLWASLKLKL